VFALLAEFDQKSLKKIAIFISAYKMNNVVSLYAMSFDLDAIELTARKIYILSKIIGLLRG
jgi:hypothetical protein